MLILRGPRIVSLRHGRLAHSVSPTLRRPRCPPYPLSGVFFAKKNIATAATRAPSHQRANMLDASALMMDTESELFNDTTSRFLMNNARHLQERRRVFDIPGLLRIIARKVHCKMEGIVDFKKLSEGGFNRVFLVTLHNGFQLVARIPYPLLVPKSYVIASEVATMAFLRSKGIPIPEVLGYSFTSDNGAKTEYIVMAFAKGVDLSKIWLGLDDTQIGLLMDQLAKLESILMSLSFPAGGSIYFAEDLKKLCGEEEVPLEEENAGATLQENVESLSLQEDSEGISLKKGRFVVGPDVTPLLWYGRRQGLDVFRGPCTQGCAGAKKELAYLEQFGSPRAPYHRFRREPYHYKKQPPSNHVKNLHRYVSLVPSLVPKDDAVNRFCIRHPDLTENNIRVSLESPGRLEIVSLLDWQYAVVLPLFLHAGTPNSFQNEADEDSESLEEPKLPDNVSQLAEKEKCQETELLRCRRLHYHYLRSTAEFNAIHSHALTYPSNSFRRRIFNHASVMWDGETIDLLYAIMELVGCWEYFTEEDHGPCPVDIPYDEGHAALELYEALQTSKEYERALANYVGCRDDTWVPVANYENAKVLSQKALEKALEEAEKLGVTDEDLATFRENWPLFDMSDKEFEEYL